MVPLLVIITFVAIACVHALVQKRKHRVLMASLGMTAPVLPDYQFTPGHLWLDQQASGFIKIGFDELVQTFVGRPDRIHLVDEGEQIKKGETLAIITKDGKDMFLRAPIDMRIWKANQTLSRLTEKLSLDPYHRDWLYRVSIAENSTPITNLLTGDKAKHWLNNELQRLKDFVTTNLTIAPAVANTAYDGGQLVEGLIDSFDQTKVTSFEDQFLNQLPE